MRLRQIDLDAITLTAGSHTSLNQGACAMEMVSYVAGEPWSDAPDCTSPVIAAFLRSWNDCLPNDETRTRLLRPLILPAVGTRCDAETDARLAWLAMDWLARVQAPAWMRLTMALRGHAEALAGLPEITVSTWPIAKPIVAAAMDAARDAARAAADATAWAAAWDAARAAAMDAARDAARAAADATAWAAAWDAARAAAMDAARAALQPTIKELQGSASALVLRMCVIAKAKATS